MNTSIFDANPKKNARTNNIHSRTSCLIPGYGGTVSGFHPRRKSKFRDHLPLHPDRRTFRPSRFCLIPSNLPSLKASSVKIYLILSRHADNVTQRCHPSQEAMAEELGCTQRTVRRGIAELLSLGLIEVLKTSLGNYYTMLNVPEGASANGANRTKMSSRKEGTKPNEYTGVKNTPVYSSTVANAPVPRARERFQDDFISKRPESGSPDEPPAASERQESAANPGKPAENPKRSRKSFWNRRQHSVYRPLTPVQKAAEQVLVGIGYSKHQWRTREAVAHAIVQWIRDNPGKGPEWAINKLVIHWREYQHVQRSGALRRDFPWCAATFFGENHWRDQHAWGWDYQAMRIAREARAGSQPLPPPPVDVEKVKAKTAKLIAAHLRPQEAERINESEKM